MKTLNTIWNYNIYAMFTKDIELKRFWRTIAKGSFLAFAISLIVINGVASATSSGIASANETIGKWEVYEVTLITTNSYSNPYKDVTLSATFNGPGGEELTLEGFWDGGNTWKVRIAPTKVGTWTYTITSSDDQLNGTTGTFETVSSDKKGFIKVNPDYRYSFMYDDGTPFFWMGDTLWDDPGYDRFKDYIDLISSHGYNSYHNIVAHDRYDYQENEGGAPFEMIDAAHRNYDRLRPEFFQEYDKRVTYANSKGLMPQFWITWSVEFVKFDQPQYESYVRYMIARYAAYEVAWVVSGEYDHPGVGADVSEYAYHGNVIYQRDPYKHPISIHPWVSNNEFGNDAWLTYVMLQSNHISFDHAVVHAAIINDRTYDKPVVDGEPEYLRPDTGITIDGWRKTAWSTVLAGGYFDTGYQHIFWDPDNHYGYTHSGWDLDYPENIQGMAQMKHLYDFFQKVEFWNMTPSDNLVSSGTAYCLANAGQEYVIYLPDGGSVTVELSYATGTLNVEWYDPKDGTYRDRGTVTGGGSKTFTPLFGGDAVLHISTDTFPPTTTYVITPAPNEAGWNNVTPVVVTFFRAGSGSGISHTNYSKTSEMEPWTTVNTSAATGPDAGNVTDITEGNFNVTVLKEGTTEIWYYSVDNNTNIETTKNVTVKIDTTSPILTNPNATPDVIPDDTDNVPLWGENSTLNVTVTDDSGIVSVTINLSAIGGLPVQPMTNIEGNIWSITTNASNGTAGWNGTAYVPYQLQVNATDISGKSNTSVSIELTVMKNGDVTGDGFVDLGDGIRLVNYDFSGHNPMYSFPSDTIADVTGDGIVDFGDGIRLVNYDFSGHDPSYILK